MSFTHFGKSVFKTSDFDRNYNFEKCQKVAQKN